MPSTASWVEGLTLPVERGTLRGVLDQVSVDVAERPVIMALRSEEAEITIVVGDPTGTVLVYFPPDYARTALGSLLSVGDRLALAADRARPPLVADHFGHWTEFPRWSVVPHSLGEQALQEFLDRPSAPPHSIIWEPD